MPLDKCPRCGGHLNGPHGSSDGPAIMICDVCGNQWYLMAHETR